MTLRSAAIVGRPNVGKSSLFNRLTRRREAIVADQAGVTRDVKEGRAVLDDGSEYLVLDTGGLWSGDRWESSILEAVEIALRGVDLVLFCVEGRSGLSPADHEIAAWLRRSKVPVVLVATKLDDARHEESPDFFELLGLGFGEPIATSATQGRGMVELEQRIADSLGEEEDVVGEEAITVAIVGRPNVGKSSLLNALLGNERVIVSDVAGTTRDSIDVTFNFGGRPFVLVDTAGIRRKPERDVAYYAKLRSEAAIRRSDVVVLVIDPFELGDHEMRIAALALEAGKPVVIAINKWDLVEDHQLQEFTEKIHLELSHLDFAPHVYTSAVTDFGLHEVLATVTRVYEASRKRVSTGALNGWIEVWTQRQAPPNFKGRSLKLLYATQADIAPPTFVFSVNSETFMTRAYEQYLRNRIREDLGFDEVPFRLIFKARSGDGKRVRL